MENHSLCIKCMSLKSNNQIFDGHNSSNQILWPAWICICCLKTEPGANLGNGGRNGQVKRMKFQTAKVLRLWLWWVHVVLLSSLHRSCWKCTSPLKCCPQESRSTQKQYDEHVAPKVLGLEPPKKHAKHDVSGMMNLAVWRNTWNKVKLTPGHWSNVKLPDVENVLSSHKVLSPEILPERSSPAFPPIHLCGNLHPWSQILVQISAAPMSSSLNLDSRSFMVHNWEKVFDSYDKVTLVLSTNLKKTQVSSKFPYL